MDFEPFLDDWRVVNEQESKFHTALIQHNALIAACDDELDVLVDAIQQAALLETKNDRKAPLFLLYSGVKRAHEIKRPILAGQLEIMRAWIPSLLGSSSSVLPALGQRVEQKVAAADALVASQAVAEQQNRDFRAIGARKAPVDNLNALRKASCGKHSSPANQELRFQRKEKRANAEARGRREGAKERNRHLHSCRCAFAPCVFARRRRRAAGSAGHASPSR